MNNTLLKSILAGLLIGAALFIMPFFLLRFFIFIFIIGLLFRLFGRGRHRRGWGRGWGYGPGPMPAFADRIRQMSDEEYNTFKQRFSGNCYGYDAPKENKENQTPENK
ncbi:hypothetical protein IC229_15985 [Spirosoma sp. BT702]|uniref:Uncharacterized protein n=1 Tax=Spirosoma profusum TaxID=2771354 RepID=A0A926Y1C7_9BACT|nr:hypothetical protein [Spirosoma profusum]MBD2702152.1 hypothetical protein [Spirosoma profusum]